MAFANRLVGILHGCLSDHTSYDEAIAWSVTSSPLLDTLNAWDI
jgi:hypothetical protein